MSKEGLKAWTMEIGEKNTQGKGMEQQQEGK